MEEGVESASCDVAVAVAAAAAAARGVADMQKVAPDIEGSRIPVAFAPELGCRYGHAAHGSATTRLMLESSIVECGRLVADTVFAACGQRPLCRVLLVDLVSLPKLNARVVFSRRKAEFAYLRMKTAQIWGCRRDLGRNIRREGRDRSRQGAAENMGTGDGAVHPDSKGVEKGMSWRVDFGVENLDAAVDGQCVWIANVADAVNQGLAGQGEDDAGSK